MTKRLYLSAALVALLVAGLGWVVSLGRLPPADFSFANESEVQSLDPAVVSGQPEGRILWAIYEPLVQLDPDDRTAKPGVASEWDISEDGRTYTWHLRDNAVWSNGEPVTAHDFVYSYRRFLDPLTSAKYAQAMWCVENAERYSLGTAALVEGDPVEIELHERPEGALPHARGEVLRGKLLRIERDPDYVGKEIEEKDYAKRHTFVVETDDGEQRFRVTGKPGKPGESTDYRACKALLLDFNEVGIHATDDHTLVTQLTEPTPYWPELIGFYALSPVNQTCVETHGWPDWTKPDNIVTNGPYEVQFRRIRDRIRLVKSPTYWDRDNVRIEVIDALVVESLTTAFNLYETGQVDWVPKVSPLISRELLKTEPPRPDFNPSEQLGTYFYAINVTRPPLDDVRVRRALSLALNRKQIVDTVGAGETPTRSFVPPGLPGYTPQECGKEDLKEARRLLAEAGYPEGVGFPRIELLYNSSEEHETIAELVRKQWQEHLGISVAARKEEWGTYLSSLAQLNFGVSRRAWIGDYMDPNTFLDMFMSNNGNNQTGFSNPEYDALLTAAAAETDTTKRLAILAEAERLLMIEQPIIPIYTYVSRNLVRPSVRGFYNNVQDSHPLSSLWIDPDPKGPNEFMRGAPR